jgi:hypothetical protein
VAKPKRIEAPGEFNGKQCAFNDHGYRCQNDGHMSTTTLGDGPWYCRAHFAKLMGWLSWEAGAVNDSEEEIDKRVNKIVPRREGESMHDWSMRCKDHVMAFVKAQTAKAPNRDWARKILERESNGEPVTLHALLAAREVVVINEPGELG